MNKWHLAVVATTLGSTPALLHAQDFPPIVDSSWMMNMAMGSAMSEAAGGSAEYIHQPKSADTRQVSPAEVKTLAFKPSATRRRANLASFVAKSRASDPVGAAAMEQLFASTDVLAQLDEELAKQGLSVANVADAYTIWWITVWEAANGVSSDTPQGTIDAVKGQAARALLAVPAFTGASDADKQNLAESLLVQAMLLDAMNDSYREDATLGPQLRSAAAQGARGMGLDLSAMTLTADGFVSEGAARETARPAPAPAPSRSASVALVGGPRPPAGLAGIWRNDWVENVFQPFSGLTLMARNVTFVFTPGGYFFDEIPVGVGLDDAGAQAWMRDHPDGGGRFEVRGDKILLTYASGKTDGMDARKVQGGWSLAWGSRPLGPKLTFPDGATLSGVYGNETITNVGIGYVAGAHDYEFTADGRVAYGRRVSMSTADLSSVGGREGQSGRYRVEGSALRIDWDDGTAAVHSLFAESPNSAIWIDDQMYKPAASDD